MATDTIKALRMQADTMIGNGVRNREAFNSALPVLIDLQAKIDMAKKNLAACVKAATILSELCSAYALNHGSVFDEGRLVASQQGVQIGDVTLGEQTFHFAHGYDGYERTEPKAKITQDFLATLPDAWRKTSVKLDVSAINAEDPTNETLADYGLRQKVKDVWSEVVG